MDARLVGYFAVLGIGGADAAHAMRGWDVREATRNSEVVGLVATNGTEIHIVPLVERRAMSRRNILEFLAPLIERYGYATTRVPLTETNHRLRERLGFVRTWDDDQFSYWVATAIPYQKHQEEVCQ